VAANGMTNSSGDAIFKNKKVKIPVTGNERRNARTFFSFVWVNKEGKRNFLLQKVYTTIKFESKMKLIMFPPSVNSYFGGFLWCSNDV
jgi:hypothetical protein